MSPLWGFGGFGGIESGGWRPRLQNVAPPGLTSDEIGHTFYAHRTFLLPS